MAMAKRDKNVQRTTHALSIRAADLTWAWVAHMKQTGETIGEVWRPELGILGTPVVLWELQAHATTGWNTEVRSLISKGISEKVMLSRKVLESIHWVTEGVRAEEHGVSVGDLHVLHVPGCEFAVAMGFIDPAHSVHFEPQPIGLGFSLGRLICPKTRKCRVVESLGNAMVVVGPQKTSRVGTQTCGFMPGCTRLNTCGAVVE